MLNCGKRMGPPQQKFLKLQKQEPRGQVVTTTTHDAKTRYPAASLTVKTYFLAVEEVLKMLGKKCDIVPSELNQNGETLPKE